MSKRDVEKSHLSEKFLIDGFSLCVPKRCAYFYFELTLHHKRIVELLYNLQDLFFPNISTEGYGISALSLSTWII